MKKVTLEIRPSYRYDNSFIGMVSYLVCGNVEMLVGTSCPIRKPVTSIDSCDWF